MFKNQKKCSQNESLEPLAVAEGRAPAKLILSGEHAILYGAPALAIPIDCRFVIKIRPLDSSGLHFKSPIIGIDARYTPDAVFQIAQKTWNRYADFEAGVLPIAAVLNQQHDLLICALAAWLNHHGRTLSQGIQVSAVSAIPVGYGLGSSAAGIVALFRALENYFASYSTPQAFFEQALMVEHLQHGISSGVDIAVCQTELPCLYDQESLEEVYVPEMNNAWLVHTGKPEVSTGTCVQAVKTHFQNSSLVERFKEVTVSLVQALGEDEKKLFELVAENHRLLCQIGVVPEKIRRFVQQIESLGGAAKLCGAGSTQGDKGGIAFVLGNPERIQPVLNQFGYSYEPLRCAHHVAAMG